MMTITRYHTKSKSAKLEGLTGIRIAATEYVIRPGQAPQFIRVIPALKNR